MRRQVKKLLPVLWVVAFSLAFSLTAPAHVHLCFDGRDQPSTLHIVEPGFICHAGNRPAGSHQDQVVDVASVGAVIAKKDVNDQTKDPVIIIDVIVALMPQQLANNVSLFAKDRPFVNHPYLNQQQLRGPPL